MNATDEQAEPKMQRRPLNAVCKECGRDDGDLIQCTLGVYVCDGSCQLQARKAAERISS